ncbi:MAG: polyprenol monophosphomannose synthase [Nitrososphaerales archaeon]|nr:polyprenol monophosphomannose synthase [Nitrososphaerales archaeon]
MFESIDSANGYRKGHSEHQEKVLKNPKRVSVVIPTLNEVDTIGRLIEELESLGIIEHIVIVDDGSTDGTVDTLIEMNRRYGNIILKERGRRLGFGSAINDGLNIILKLQPPPDLVVVMDADLSHNPIYIPKMVELCYNADLVLGSRYVRGGRIEGWGLKRRIISGFANWIARSLLRLDVRDVTTGYRCYSRRAVEVMLPLKSKGYVVQVETLLKVRRRRLRIVELPITFVDRIYGKSKLGVREMIDFLIFIIRNI